MDKKLEFQKCLYSQSDQWRETSNQNTPDLETLQLANIIFYPHNPPHQKPKNEQVLTTAISQKTTILHSKVASPNPGHLLA